MPTFSHNSKVYCYHNDVLYEATILSVEGSGSADDGGVRYYVHYTGWAKKWDEWVFPDRVLEISPETTLIRDITVQAAKERELLAQKALMLPYLNVGSDLGSRPNGLAYQHHHPGPQPSQNSLHNDAMPYIYYNQHAFVQNNTPQPSSFDSTILPASATSTSTSTPLQDPRDLPAPALIGRKRTQREVKGPAAQKQSAKKTTNEPSNPIFVPFMHEDASTAIKFDESAPASKPEPGKRGPKKRGRRKVLVNTAVPGASGSPAFASRDLYESSKMAASASGAGAASTSAAASTRSTAAISLKSSLDINPDLNNHVESLFRRLGDYRLELFVPTFLSNYLYLDYIFINAKKRLVRLPSRNPIDSIMREFIASEANNPQRPGTPEDYILQFVEGLIFFFNQGISSCLLYKFERYQYHEYFKPKVAPAAKTRTLAPLSSKKATPSSIYGPEHLLRLLSSLPNLLLGDFRTNNPITNPPLSAVKVTSKLQHASHPSALKAPAETSHLRNTRTPQNLAKIHISDNDLEDSFFKFQTTCSSLLNFLESHHTKFFTNDYVDALPDYCRLNS